MLHYYVPVVNINFFDLASGEKTSLETGGKFALCVAYVRTENTYKLFNVHLYMSVHGVCASAL